MLSMLKDYGGAEAEYKAFIHIIAVDLLVSLWSLTDALVKKGDQIALIWPPSKERNCASCSV